MEIVRIGLDGGGTSTRLLAANASNRRWQHKSGASNPRIVGIERTVEVVSELIAAAMHEYAGASQFRVCAGLAGAATTAMQSNLAKAIMLNLSDASAVVTIQITDDATIAYEAAFAGQPGVLFLVGTGSMVLVRLIDGSKFRTGGWGYLLGDEGSGYNIGRAGLRAVSASVEAAESTPLTRQALELFGPLTRESIIERVYDASYPMAAFANGVLSAADRGDAQSQEILEDEIRALVGRLLTLTEREGLVLPTSVKVTGGLSQSRCYVLNLTRIIRTYFPETEVTASDREPVEGALWLANQIEG